MAQASSAVPYALYAYEFVVVNKVERFFRDITTQAVRRGLLPQRDALIAAYGKSGSMKYTSPNITVSRFVWTAAASDILEKVKRGRQMLYKVQSE